MSDILAKLQAVHDKRQMVKVDVPEYGVAWYFPPFTVADHEAVRKGINPKHEHELMVAALMHMAHDEAGNRVFDLPMAERTKVRAELHRMELGVLQRIIAESGGGLGQAAAAEVAALDTDALRAVLLGFAGEEAPRLAEAARAVDASVLQRSVTVILEAHEAGQDEKND